MFKLSQSDINILFNDNFVLPYDLTIEKNHWHESSLWIIPDHSNDRPIALWDHGWQALYTPGDRVMMSRYLLLYSKLPNINYNASWLDVHLTFPMATFPFVIDPVLNWINNRSYRLIIREYGIRIVVPNAYGYDYSYYSSAADQWGIGQQSADVFID
jgi:hypothetical protein